MLQQGNGTNSRLPQMKWREQDEKALRNAVANFNRKLTRLEKQQNIEGLPDRIPLKTLKSKITTRQQFNREINRIKRFNKKGAEEIITNQYGVKATAWVIREAKINARVITTSRTRELKKLNEIEVTNLGKPVGLNRGEMHSQRQNELRPKKFNFETKRSYKELQMALASIEKQSNAAYDYKKRKDMQDNYIKGLHNVYGAYARNIIATIKEMSPDDFYFIYMSEEQASFEYQYDVIGEVIAEKISELSDIWGAEKNEIELNDLMFDIR